MAKEQSESIQIEGCSVIYDMGSGLVIAKVQIDKVKEQDINARVMKNEMQDQLTANISKRGQMESLPFLVLKDGKLEIALWASCFAAIWLRVRPDTSTITTISFKPAALALLIR